MENDSTGCKENLYIIAEEINTMPFGTQLDVYDDGYEWINHSIRSISLRSTA